MRRSSAAAVARSRRSVGLFGLDHADGDFEEVADHGFDIAADVADFGVLGGFDFDEGGLGEVGEAAGDFGFADAGGADHEDVFGDDGLGQGCGELLAAPAVSDGDGDGAFGGGLADDVLVELGDDLLGGEGDLGHGEDVPLLARAWRQVAA